MIDSISGSGTEEDPYQITNISELQSVRKEPYSCYELANDIDAGETKEWNHGRGFIPIGGKRRKFSGSFNGNNHEIRELHIDRPTNDCTGLFGHTHSGSVVENVGIVNADITGDEYVGGIVGANYGDNVTNSYVTGNITGNYCIGGIVGWNDGCDITNSYATANINGNKSIGGLVGFDTYGYITKSYATGEIIGEKDVGGIAGVIRYSLLSGCWSTTKPVFENELRSKNINGTFCFSRSNHHTLEDPDLAISREKWEISYSLESNTLYLQYNGETYSDSEASPLEVLKLARDFKKDVVKITDRFKDTVLDQN
jgi:hypothetical protein